MKNNDFSIRGYRFHLNDNRVLISKYNYEFFPKYKLLVLEGGAWNTISCVDTKAEARAEALRYIREATP